MLGERQGVAFAGPAGATKGLFFRAAFSELLGAAGRRRAAVFVELFEQLFESEREELFWVAFPKESKRVAYCSSSVAASRRGCRRGAERKESM